MKFFFFKFTDCKVCSRNSSFELMRLVAMFMIVWGHCMLATAQNAIPYLGVLDNIGWGVKSLTICAVNLFFLLTGFYITTFHFKMNRVLNLWIKTIFYSIFIYILLSFLCGFFSFGDFIGYIFPIFTKKYWFIQTYIVIALCSPFIAMFLNKLNNSQLNYLLLIFFVFFCLHESFFKVEFTLDQTSGYGIIWALVMVFTGHNLYRYFSVICNIKIWYFLFGYLLFSLLIFISNYLIVKYNIAGGVSSREKFYSYNSFTVLFQSICLFCFFIKLSSILTSNIFINYFGKNTLSVYLISAHPLILFSLWRFVFDSNIVNAPFIFLFLSLVFSLMILIICILVDKSVDKIFSLLHIEIFLKKINIFFEAYVK